MLLCAARLLQGRTDSWGELEGSNFFKSARESKVARNGMAPCPAEESLLRRGGGDGCTRHGPGGSWDKAARLGHICEA